MTDSIEAKNSPIGVFDSGVGGLAIARYLRECLPQEDFIFFGDTAHLPYGDRNADELLSYTEAIVQFLLQWNIKTLVVACNTVSTVAGDWLHHSLDIPVIDVINPIAKRLSSAYRAEQRVGLVGTKITVNSGVYEDRIRRYGGQFDFQAWALPELVPMIEHSTVNYGEILQLLKRYSVHLGWAHLDGLILGCTHYPWVYTQFREALNVDTELWDAGAITAQELRAQLVMHDLLTTRSAAGAGIWSFYLSEQRGNVQNLIAKFWQQYRVNLVKWRHHSLELV